MAGADDLKANQDLVKALDAPEAAGSATRTILPLKHAQAQAISTALTAAETGHLNISRAS